MSLPWAERLNLLRQYTSKPCDLTFAQQLEKLSLLLEWEAKNREKIQDLTPRLAWEHGIPWDSIELVIGCEGPYQDGYPWDFSVFLRVHDSQREEDSYGLQLKDMNLAHALCGELTFPIFKIGKREIVLNVSPFYEGETSVMVKFWELYKSNPT